MKSNEFLLQSCRKEGVNSVLNPFQGKGADFEIYFIEILEKCHNFYSLDFADITSYLPSSPSPKFYISMCQIIVNFSLPYAAEIICESSLSDSA